MNIKEIIDSERWELFGGFDTEVKRHNASLDRIEAAVMEKTDWAETYKESFALANKRIAELEAQNLNMMALFRDFYELEFNRDECWEIIKKYGG